MKIQSPEFVWPVPVRQPPGNASVGGVEVEGEPASYTLPALVKGDRIIADFSVPPKSAPAKFAAFKGKRTERGIEWEDGNVWPAAAGHTHQD